MALLGHISAWRIHKVHRTFVVFLMLRTSRMVSGGSCAEFDKQRQYFKLRYLELRVLLLIS